MNGVQADARVEGLAVGARAVIGLVVAVVVFGCRL